MPRATHSSHAFRIVVGLALAAALTVVLFPSALASGEEPACEHGTHQAVKVGVVDATGCWTQAMVSGATVYTAAFADNKDGIDLNGFIVNGGAGDGLQINAGTRAVTSITIATGKLTSVQLYSHNWPSAGINALGTGTVISFAAPTDQPVTLDTLHFGSGGIVGAIVSLLPVVGQVETNVVLEPGGGGSMDLTFSLAGIFTLKDKPQSLTIALPTEPEEGTKFDGFELKLKEITGLKFVTIYDLEARYSASKKIISGSLSVGFPFMEKGKGVIAGFAMQNGTTRRSRSASIRRSRSVPARSPTSPAVSQPPARRRWTSTAGASRSATRAASSSAPPPARMRSRTGNVTRARRTTASTSPRRASGRPLTEAAPPGTPTTTTPARGNASARRSATRTGDPPAQT